jgi:hypothetical protein
MVSQDYNINQLHYKYKQRKIKTKYQYFKPILSIHIWYIITQSISNHQLSCPKCLQVKAIA